MGDIALKDDVGRWTNIGDETCPECQAEPGEEHAHGCETGNRDTIVDGPDFRKVAASLNATHAAMLSHRAEEKQKITQLQAWGFPKEVIKRALADQALSSTARGKHDSAYALVRAALGIPLQTEAFVEHIDDLQDPLA